MVTLFVLGIAKIEAILHPSFSENHIIELISDGPLSLEGAIYEPPERGLDKTKLYIELSRLYIRDTVYPLTGKLLLTVGKKETGLRYGDTIRFLAKVRRPRNFHNPGGFDYEKYLALKAIFATAYLNDAEGTIKIAEGHSFIEDMRGAIRDNIIKNAGDTAPVLLALVTGEQGEITREIREDFSNAGTAHILAISGEHIGIIALASFALFLWLFKCSEWIMLSANIYKIGAALTIPVVVLYSLIAGGGFSILRAAIMGGTLLAAILVDRRRDIPSLIASAAFLILLFEPQALFDISFQLSFASVISLAMAAPYLKRVYSRGAEEIPETGIKKAAIRIISRLALPAAVSIAAIIGTAPLAAHYFNRFSIIAPLSNLITVPLVGLIIVPLGLISSILLPVSQSVSGWLVTLDAYLLSFIVKLTRFFASLPFASVRVVTPNLFEMSLFYLFLILLIYRKGLKRSKQFIFAVSALMVVLESFFFFNPLLGKELKVTFLDVGQSESALIEFPGGKRMLIDGGGLPLSDFDMGERVVAPFLWNNKIMRIDYVVLSHPNSDHFGGLPFILRNFNIGEVWEGGTEEDSAGYAEFKSAVRESRAVYKKMEDGAGLHINGVMIDVLNPAKGYAALDDRAANNGSMVIKMTYGETSFLFTGDIEEKAESLLLSKGELLKSTVLKVPHHGSSTSSTTDFLNSVRPDTAVFSVGHRNRFGFPKDVVLKRYREVNAEIFRTDIDGAIEAVSDGMSARLSKTLNSY